MGFTENQLRAITTGGNIIVSAGAGSGKTTVMIARILDKLKKGERLESMLIVTFTRASAADMRVKLTEKLYELKADPAFYSVANAALDQLPASNIGTLHSYCQKLIKTYFYAADLDPSSAVCEETEAAGLKRAAVSDAVEAAWTIGDPYFLAVYDMLCSGRSDDGVKNAVCDVLDFALSMPDPQAYLSYAAPDRDSFAALDGIVEKRRAELENKINALKVDLATAGMAKHVAAAEDMLLYIGGGIDEITPTSHRARHDYTDELNEQFKALKAECKAFRAFATEAEQSKQIEAQPYAQSLLGVAADAYRRYAERKRSLGKIDYSDLEHGAYSVLSDGACLDEVTKNIKYVFIDEFQDVNPLQSAIADMFRRAGAEMFVVGDVKQSIYGFRRCSPEHFKRALESPDYTHIPLTDNFRSSRQVVDFVNSVFDGVMTDDFGGVEYSSAEQRLVCGNTRLDGSAAFYVAEDKVVAEQAEDDSVCTENAPPAKKSKTQGYSVIDDAMFTDSADGEAELVAGFVGEYIKNSDSPQLGGIAVLLRALSTPFTAALGKAFERRNIKYCIGKKNKVRSYPEAVALMDILRCVDNRLDDVALYTAMRSGMGGFSDGELYEIAHGGERACRKADVTPISADGKYLLWQKVENYRGVYRDRVDRFIALLSEIAKYALTHDCADVLGLITAKIDYFQHVYETGGSAAAVDALIRFAADRAMDSHAFLEYYDDGDFDLAADGGGDVVTVTTIHASKGLEYDLVIVADTAKRFNETDRYARVITSENGVFLKVPNDVTHMLDKSAPWMVENALYPERWRAEELRLLYVALTRAKKSLIVCGKKKALKQVEPKDSNCMLRFLSGVAPQPMNIEFEAVGSEAQVEYAFDQDIADEVTARHSFTESYNARRKASAVPVKTCVTAVSHNEWENADYTVTSPVLTADDRGDEGVDSMLRGTAYHRAMELVDFASPDIKALQRSCENFDLVNGDEILAAAAVMRELTLNAAFVAKERYFIVDLPSSVVYGNNADGSVLVQGVIDLLIVDNDGNAVIVDYKTGNPASLNNEAYRTQLRLYALAVERTTPFKVKRAVLYSFAAGKIIEQGL